MVLKTVLKKKALMRHFRKFSLRYCALFLLVCCAIFLVYPVPSGRIHHFGSLQILSSEGNLLREFRSSDDGSFAEWRDLKDYPSFLVAALIAAEDHRFRYHCGFDPIAIFRATEQNIKNRRIVSGGSTITQQLVRICWRQELPSMHLLRKGAEMALALRTEISFSKDEIIEGYLNRVPLRYNQTGFASASRRIFGRDISFLSHEELTALVVLVRQNEPGRSAFEKRFRQLWHRLSPDEPRGLDQIIACVFSASSQKSTSDDSVTRHFEDWIHAENPRFEGELHTSISENLNSDISDIVNNELLFLEQYDTENAAVVVLSRDSSDCFPLVAMVGSRRFHYDREGQINGAIAVREAGSSLKPALYALAMDEKGYLPNTIVNDTITGFRNSDGGTYFPRNYDLACWGPLTIREALGASRNIPAVAMIRDVSVESFYHLLLDAGYSHLQSDSDYYGYGLALGIGGTSLMQLARLYGALANGGVILPVKIGTDWSGNNVSIGDKRRLFSEKNSWYITSILNDRDIRRRANGNRNFLDFPFDIAIKTGTSKDYRDAWTVGYTSEYVIGVWTGNFSGKPMRRVSGSWGAGRIFHQVVRRLSGKRKPVFSWPKSFTPVRLCRSTGLLAGPGCPSYIEMLEKEDFPARSCTGNHASGSVPSAEEIPIIVSPASNEVFVLNDRMPAARQLVPIQISRSGNSADRIFHYKIDELPPRQIIGQIDDALFLPRGEHCVVIMENGSEIDSIRFSVE